MSRYLVWLLGGGTVAAAGAVALWLTTGMRDAPVPVGEAVREAAREAAGESGGEAVPSAPAERPEAAVDTAETSSVVAGAEPVPPAGPALLPPGFDVVRVARDGAALVAGTAAPGAAVTLRVDGVVVAEAAADGAGQFVALFSLASGDAPQVMTLEMQDAAGVVVMSEDTVILSPRPAELAMLAPESEAPVAASRDRAPVAEAGALGGAAPEQQPETEGAAVTPGAPQTAATVDTAPELPVDSAAAQVVTDGNAVAAESAEPPAASDAADAVQGPVAVTADASPAESRVVTSVADATPDTALAEAETPNAAPETTRSPNAETGGSGTLESAATGPLAARTDEDSARVTVSLADVTPRTGEAGATATAPVAADRDTSADALSLQSTAEPGGDAPTAVAGAAEADMLVEQSSATEEVIESASGSAAVEDLPTAILLRGDGQIEVLDRAPRVMDNVVIDSISYTDRGAVQISGRAARADPAADLRVYLDNRPIAVARAEGGDWRLDLPAIDPGVYRLRVDQLNSAGRVVSRFETPFQRETPERVAQAQAAAAGAAASGPAVMSEAPSGGVEPAAAGDGGVLPAGENSGTAPARVPDPLAQDPLSMAGLQEATGDATAAAVADAARTATGTPGRGDRLGMGQADDAPGPPADATGPLPGATASAPVPILQAGDALAGAAEGAGTRLPDTDSAFRETPPGATPLAPSGAVTDASAPDETIVTEAPEAEAMATDDAPAEITGAATGATVETSAQPTMTGTVTSPATTSADAGSSTETIPLATVGTGPATDALALATAQTPPPTDEAAPMATSSAMGETASETPEASQVTASAASETVAGAVRTAGEAPSAAPAVTVPASQPGTAPAATSVPAEELRIAPLTGEAPAAPPAARAAAPAASPAPSQVAASVAMPDAPPRVALVTVQPGHTLWHLSNQRYGAGERYVIIYRANRSQIRDPDLIYPGQIFTLPDE